MVVSIREVEREALDMGVEDLYGLWELLWGLPVRFPGKPDSVLRSAAADALATLVKGGWIVLAVWNPTTDEQTNLDAVQAKDAIALDKNWSPPERADAKQIRFVATEAGERAYSQQAVGA